MKQLRQSDGDVEVSSQPVSVASLLALHRLHCCCCAVSMELKSKRKRLSQQTGAGLLRLSLQLTPEAASTNYRENTTAGNMSACNKKIHIVLKGRCLCTARGSVYINRAAFKYCSDFSTVIVTAYRTPSVHLTLRHMDLA